MRQQRILVISLMAAVVALASACLRLNCGGKALPGGIKADRPDFYSMTSSWVAKYTNKSDSEDYVYDSHSWTSARDLVYTFVTPPNGTFDVSLLFAEIWTGAARKGARVLNLAVNNKTVVRELDVWHKTNGKMHSPVIVRIPRVVPINDEIEVRISRVKGNPFISGINISPYCPGKSK